MIHLDATFRRRITGAFGETGARWLGSLPRLVADCVERWELQEVRQIQELSYSWVARVRRSGRAGVLKISVPGFESASEIDALRTFPSHVACELYEAAPEMCAILIEELDPGETLWSVPDPERRVAIACELFRRLHGDATHRPTALSGPARVGPDASGVVFPAFVAIARRALEHAVRMDPADGDASSTTGWRRPLRAAAREALAALDSLESDATARAELGSTLIHADLHHGNILSSGSTWRLIDPKGVAGPVWLEGGRFILNQYDEAPADRRERDFRRTVQAFAEALDVGPERVALGAALDAAVSAVWSWEDGDDERTMIRASRRATEIAVWAGVS